jgi:hypothetical protein
MTSLCKQYRKGLIQTSVCKHNRQGLSNRWPASNDQLQVRVDVLQGDVDEEIEGLQSKVRKLKGVSK